MHNVVSSKFKTLSFRDESKTHVTPVMTIFMTCNVAKINPRNKMYESKLNPQTSKSFQYQACLPISSSLDNKNHGVDNAISTVLLSSYNKQNNTTKQNKHTHTRPKTKTNVARLESTRKQRPTVSANPHLREEGRRMRRKKKRK